MQQEEGLTGAPRGTAYHRVMELLDFAGMQKYGNMQWFGGWLEEQVRHGRLEEEAAGCIRQADILEFLQCNSGKRMQEAARKQKLTENSHLYSVWMQKSCILRKKTGN